jgi:hypothetical protein
MVCVFSRFSRKARIDELKVMQKAIDTQLRTFSNHIRVIQQDFDILAKKNAEIIELLKENNQNGQ